MKFKFHRNICSFFILLLVFNVVVVGQENEKEWMLLFIVNGDNSLVDEAILDLKSIARIGSSDQINVFVHFAKSTKSKLNMRWTGLKTFHVKKNDKYDAEEAIRSDVTSQIKDVGSINRLVEDLKTSYPARKHMIIFWDHANILNRPPIEPEPTFANTDYRLSLWPKYNYYTKILGSEGNRLNFEKFVQLLPNTSSNSEFTPIFTFLDNTTFGATDLQNLSKNISDILLFDACLLANLEMAKVLEERTDYMLASQEVVNASTSHKYDDLISLLTKNPSQSAEDFAKLIMRQFRKHSKHGALSLISPRNINTTIEGLEEFSTAVIKAIDEKSLLIQDIIRIRNNCLTLGKELNDNKTIDFIEFLKKFKRGMNDKLLKDQVKKLLKQLKKNNVILDSHGPSYYPNLNGISIYYPKYPLGIVDAKYVKITPTESWNKLLIKIQKLIKTNQK